MPYSLDVYDEHFFSNNQAEGLRHAEWFMPLLEGLFHFKSLVDVGCGTGHFVKWCDDHGISSMGIEGSPFGVANSIGAIVIQMDLRTPSLIEDMKRFDLCLCIEVAEHIEEEYVNIFVDTLCSLSDTIVMTAAPPGQGGLQHVNEAPQEYWQSLMALRGFGFDFAKTTALKEGVIAARANGFHVAPWLPGNLMIYHGVGL
jgi:SAM-dependent methyltransferase